MPFLNQNNLPPEGYFAYIPETNFTSRKYVGVEDAVTEIQRHRQANPRFGWATDKDSIRRWLLDYTEARLRAMPGGAGMAWLTADSPPSNGSFSFPPRQRQPGRASSEFAAAAKARAGIGLLADFLGPTLRAVPHELAEQRGAVCVTCPENQKGGALQHALGEGLKLLLEARSELKLFTSHDTALYECRVCECNLHLKPHVDLAYILEKTSPEQMEAFPNFCWIKTRDAKLD